MILISHIDNLVGTYFWATLYSAIYIIIITVITANKATFVFLKVVWRHYSDEVGEFIIF